jgi:hypothetical protein
MQRPFADLGNYMGKLMDDAIIRYMCQTEIENQIDTIRSRIEMRIRKADY